MAAILRGEQTALLPGLHKRYTCNNSSILFIAVYVVNSFFVCTIRLYNRRIPFFFFHRSISHLTTRETGNHWLADRL